MSGVASNFTAAAHYIGNFVPGLFADLGLTFNPATSPFLRGQAGGRFSLKFIALAVLAYVVMLEFSQLRSGDARRCRSLPRARSFLYRTQSHWSWTRILQLRKRTGTPGRIPTRLPSYAPSRP
jgi:hypothetical protein